MSKLGFIGLGIMGAPMALHLVDAGHTLFVNTRGKLPDTPDAELGVALPQTAGAAQLMQACAANGMADLDHSALVKALELMASHEVAEA